jgi:uncharacterized FAD-dependent dehydrogenase
MLKVKKNRIKEVTVIRRSVDARQRNVRINLALKVYIDEKKPEVVSSIYDFRNVENERPVAVVGAGPAGLFAALRLIELGYRPIVFERGKAVSDRKRDIARIFREGIINPDSNLGFGEGGAGAFSDGKLYTRSAKRGDVKKVLELFVQFGADPNILIDAHPHIGSDKLPRIIRNIRQQIIDSGGEVHFGCRVNGLIIKGKHCIGLTTTDGQRYDRMPVILATGHSARDVYRFLDEAGISMEAKGFAMGVRIEHPQAEIDTMQYHTSQRSEFLPPAEYYFATQVNDRGVYTFCMCPGGFIIPAATTPGEIVVNGMSASGRNSPFANAGVVVEIKPEDAQQHFKQHGIFAGLEMQWRLEQQCFALANNTQSAPAQRLKDFIAGRKSTDLPSSSYYPGLTVAPLHTELPAHISERLRSGFRLFNRRTDGAFASSNAIIAGVESRTSSPLRIPRNDKHQHIELAGLFPCGEGAGYAGGIVSAAMDGQQCATAVAMFWYEHIARQHPFFK